jgi:catechol 2,3-dioxygenase-like lactoylglutathione lyase family enzyme
MIDIGLTHIALPVTNIEHSVKFYVAYAGMKVAHHRIDAEIGVTVVWLCNHTRPFVIVLIQADIVYFVLSPLAHLDVSCRSRIHLDELCTRARLERILIQEGTQRLWLSDRILGFLRRSRWPYA